MRSSQFTYFISQRKASLLQPLPSHTQTYLTHVSLSTYIRLGTVKGSFTNLYSHSRDSRSNSCSTATPVFLPLRETMHICRSENVALLAFPWSKTYMMRMQERAHIVPNLSFFLSERAGWLRRRRLCDVGTSWLIFLEGL